MRPIRLRVPATLVSTLATLVVSATLQAEPPAPPAAVTNFATSPTATAATIAPCQGCCATAAPGVGRGWASVDYLLWWIKDQKAVPLVTTGPVLPAGSPIGALGVPGTVILLDASDLTEGARSGARFQGGIWLDDCQKWGVEFGYFFLGKDDNDYGANSADTLVIARPFTDISTGTPTPNSEVVSVPGIVVGSLTATGTSRLQGADLNSVCNLGNNCASRLDLIAGLRYLRLDEGLTVLEDVTALVAIPGANPIAAGTRFNVRDQFDTTDEFFGGQVGVRGELRRGRLVLGGLAKIALGGVRQTARIDGDVLITPPGGPAVLAPGGLLALPSNIGTYSRTAFAAVPEIGVTLGYQITDNLLAKFGYTFLCVSTVTRPADEIDLVIDTRQIPSSTNFDPTLRATRPAGGIHASSFWAQGLDFGVEYRW